MEYTSCPILNLYSVTPGSSLWFWIALAHNPQRDSLEQRGRRKHFLRNIASWQWLKDFQDTGNSDVPSSLTWPRSHFFDGIEPAAQVRLRSLASIRARL
jgi:hypothetical protein